MTLDAWGFEPCFAQPLAEDEVVARVIEEQKTSYRLITERGELLAHLTGKLLHPSVGRLERPVVGDWVVVRPLWSEQKAMVQRVLPRKSLLRRRAAGTDEDAVQPMAANVDCTFIVTSLNRDFNPKRIDRYLTVAHESGSRAAILLTKKDLAPESEAQALTLAAQHRVPCLAIATLSGDGLAELRALLVPRETVVFVGSSGVGKSTLVNALLGREEQFTASVREDDDRGRHTTTSRRLLLLESGVLVIDTPGMREIQLEAGHQAALEESFAQIEELAQRCRFSDCAHDSEPGCAVKSALQGGLLLPQVLESFQKLQRELAFRDRKTNKTAAAEEKKRWKSVAKTVRAHPKKKGGH